MRRPLPSDSRIAIVGPGAIGSLFAALMARSGCDVFLLDRQQQRATQRANTAISVHEQRATWHANVKSSTRASDFKNSDAVFICTKAYDTVSAVKSIAPLVGSETIVVSLQNGIGNAEHIETIAAKHCICASTAMGALLDETENVHWTGHGITQLAPFEDTEPCDAECIGKILTAAQCECHLQDNAQAMLWEKLIINAAINPVTAIHGISNGELLQHPEARKQAFATACEAKRVATALGITLSYEDPTAAVIEVCTKTARNRSSMLQDIEHGRPTEIEAITGAIITEANRLHIPIPMNEKLYSMIQTQQGVVGSWMWEVERGKLEVGRPRSPR